jgi:hypothetical protein
MRLVTSGCTIRLSPYMAGNDCVYEIFDKILVYHENILDMVLKKKV